MGDCGEVSERAAASNDTGVNSIQGMTTTIKTLEYSKKSGDEPARVYAGGAAEASGRAESICVKDICWVERQGSGVGTDILKGSKKQQGRQKRGENKRRILAGGEVTGGRSIDQTLYRRTAVEPNNYFRKLASLF